MTDKHARNATLYLSLTSDSGYSSGETHRISADQWERISRIVNEPAPACAPCQSCGAPVRHDTWLPDDLFAQISGDGGNCMFCPTCLVAKCCETFGWASVRLSDPRAPAPAVTAEATAMLPTCCVCGRIVDPREVDEGGDPFGAQRTDGEWTCSSECWDEALANDEESAALRALAEGGAGRG